MIHVSKEACTRALLFFLWSELLQQNLGRTFGKKLNTASIYLLKPSVTSTERSKAVVLLLWIYCSLLPPLFCGICMYGSCFVVQYLLSFAIISFRERERETERERERESWLLFFNCL